MKPGSLLHTGFVFAIMLVMMDTIEKRLGPPGVAAALIVCMVTVGARIVTDWLPICVECGCRKVSHTREGWCAHCYDCGEFKPRKP